MLYRPPDSLRTSKVNQFLATVILCLSAVAAGSGLSCTLLTYDIYHSVLFLDDYQKSWILSMFVYGAIAEALPAGILADRVGRKLTAIIIGFPFILSWLLTVVASNAMMLYFARFLLGFATGGSCVVTPMFISEFADNSIRGMLGTCFHLFLIIGTLLVYTFYAIIHWLHYVCMAVPAVYIVYIMLFVPESPIWLLKKNRHDEAVQSIKWFRGEGCDSNAVICEIQPNLKASKRFGGFRDLITVPANRKGLFITSSLMFFQQFSGRELVLYFSWLVIQAAIQISPRICHIIICVVQLLTTIVTTVLVEIIGRKMLLVLSSLGMGLSLIVLGGYYLLELISPGQYLPSVCIFVFLVSYSLGYGPIPWMMMGELLAPEVRGIATALAVLVNWVAGSIVTMMFPYLISEYIDFPSTFIILGVIMLLGTIYGQFVLFETKGKDTAQIQLLLAS